jgi:hypothetical protein
MADIEVHTFSTRSRLAPYPSASMRSRWPDLGDDDYMDFHEVRPGRGSIRIGDRSGAAQILRC